MATQNRILLFNWVRCFLVLSLIGLLLPTGSASAQTQTPGSLEKQQPVMNPTDHKSAEGGIIAPMTVTNLIQDPSFEASFGNNLYWLGQSSTNFGTPICPSTSPPPAGCGNGGGTAGPRTGSAWLWIGGTTLPESTHLYQSITIPIGCKATLQFYLWIGAAQPGSDTSDLFSIAIDLSQTVFQADATQKSSYPAYKLVSIDLSAYADGNVHYMDIMSFTNGQIVNFNLDDFSLVMGNCTCGAPVSGAAMNFQNDGVNDQLVIGQPAENSVGPFSSANGSDTTGVFRPNNGALYLKNTNANGFADIQINYGVPSDCPLVGDWDGNGTDTIGIYRNGVFYLRNSNTIGFADIVFTFGSTGGQPLAGDWNGDGIDTIGIYRDSVITFELRNSNTAGPPEISFRLGNPGDVGIAGDWNGDGLDTTGVFRPSNGVIFLKNTNSTGFAEIALNYGLPGDKPVMGDWNNDGIDTIGIYRNGTFYLRNSNTKGVAELVFNLGNPGDMPIAGNWDGIP